MKVRFMSIILKVNRKDIPDTSETPIFDYCRKLVNDGVDPMARLEVYRDREGFDIAVNNIGYGASLSVTGVHFTKYRPSHIRKAIGSSPSPVDAFKSEVGG
jgi:hypothetical protein